MSILVQKPGLLSTFQDGGRWGYQSLGVNVSGIMDPSAFRLANILVGNDVQQTCLEMTVLGASLLFEHHACIALTGAFLNPHIDDSPIQNNRAYLIKAGQTLHFKTDAPTTGARAYLAVFGGYNLPNVMHSHSTDLKSKLGGLNGQALKKQDRITLNGTFADNHIPLIKERINSQRIYLSSGLGQQKRATIRVLTGVHFDLFTPESQQQFLHQPFKISTQSDRMGYRLLGHTLNLTKPLQIFSEPSNFGTIQVPPDGNPIILMADRQSTGGYPKIANVITADLGYLAQSLPGDQIHFTLTTLEEAQQSWFERLKRFEQLKQQLHDTVMTLHQYFSHF